MSFLAGMPTNPLELFLCLLSFLRYVFSTSIVLTDLSTYAKIDDAANDVLCCTVSESVSLVVLSLK